MKFVMDLNRAFLNVCAVIVNAIVCLGKAGICSKCCLCLSSLYQVLP